MNKLFISPIFYPTIYEGEVSIRKVSAQEVKDLILLHGYELHTSIDSPIIAKIFKAHTGININLNREKIKLNKGDVLIQVVLPRKVQAEEVVTGLEIEPLFYEIKPIAKETTNGREMKKLLDLLIEHNRKAQKITELATKILAGGAEHGEPKEIS